MKRRPATKCILLTAPLALLGLAHPALGGPPYVTDDPQPTDHGHYEVYGFGALARNAQGHSATAGIDFNYGALPGLQLTAVLPYTRESQPAMPASAGFGNFELAAKYRFMHSAATGWDLAIFPRLFLPAGANGPGERNASLLLPMWVQKSGERWSSFGGGGCALHRGGDARDYCMMGIVYTRQVITGLQLGMELWHRTADVAGGDHSTGAGLGVIWDASEHLHLMGSAGPGLQNSATTDRSNWYLALLVTL